MGTFFGWYKKIGRNIRINGPRRDPPGGLAIGSRYKEFNTRENKQTEGDDGFSVESGKNLEGTGKQSRPCTAVIQ